MADVDEDSLDHCEGNPFATDEEETGVVEAHDTGEINIHAGRFKGFDHVIALHILKFVIVLDSHPQPDADLEAPKLPVLPVYHDSNATSASPKPKGRNINYVVPP